jgi:hypothetical protein
MQKNIIFYSKSVFLFVYFNVVRLHQEFIPDWSSIIQINRYPPEDNRKYSQNFIITLFVKQ